MLVFISDLHFVDGSAGEHNVPIEAFEIFLEDISWAANRLVDDGRNVEEIKIVFLGDIFDLLRTERWFPFPESERPWGTNEKKIEAQIGEPLGKADADFVRQQTGFAIGGVPPLGHSHKIDTFIDRDLLSYQDVWAAAGTPRAVFRLDPQDLPKMTGGHIMDIK